MPTGKPLSFDIAIIVPAIILQLFSFIILQSVAAADISKHIILSLSAIGAFGLASQINVRTLKPIANLLYALSLLLLTATIVLGEPIRGSTRWITISSLRFQTSELIKPLLIISLSTFATQLNLRSLKHSLLYLLLATIPIWCIAIQPDLGSAIVVAGFSLAIAIIAGMRGTILAGLALLAGLVAPLLMNVLKPYQKERIEVFFNPLSDPLGSGYSVIQSIIAVGSGKILGRGLGHGTQSQLRFLPERHSDFVFASLAEELGFIGVLLVLISFAVLLNRLLKIALLAENEMASTVAVGIFTMIFTQVVINIGMNIGLLPVTGITLPLISSGGSSLFTTMISLGVVNAMSRSKKKLDVIEIR